jgi:hypothetical protein
MTTVFAFFTAAHTIFYFPGAPFILGTILSGMGLIFAFKTLKDI